ncbi:MAG: hypothetical protein JXA25_08815 [Anaerolineales bacterium]|nr:hypothetical protein [Anaerolineales bacterium]
MLGLRCLILDYQSLDLYTNPYLKPQPKSAIPPWLCRLFDAACCLTKEERKNPLVSPAYAPSEMLKNLPQTLIISERDDSF